MERTNDTQTPIYKMCLIGDVVGPGYLLPHIPKRLTDIFSFWHKLQMIVEKTRYNDDKKKQ
ncbi:hypothetical protein HMPREF0649_00999 [Segatella buccae D17]|nr:hypothetical protein HMPREF0649_00999 [Segatella buccae D17]